MHAPAQRSHESRVSIQGLQKAKSVTASYEDSFRPKNRPSSVLEFVESLDRDSYFCEGHSRDLGVLVPTIKSKRYKHESWNAGKELPDCSCAVLKISSPVAPRVAD